jgi:hypothetical protein
MTMTSSAPLDLRERGYAADDRSVDTPRSASSAISWGAIIAGAAGAAALSLILMILGVGLGLSSVSPWSFEGISATSFGISTIVWLTLTQLLSFAMGGYLAGRLRTKWVGAHRDEVYFRDSAHGFLAWAVASLATAVLLTSVIGSILSGGIQAGASAVGGVVTTATVAAAGFTASGQMAPGESGPMAYFVDSLFRRNGSAGAASSTATPMSADESERTMTAMANEAAEVGRIFMNISRSEPLPPADLQYVAQLVAQRTGVSQQEAEKRVTEGYARAQATLNKVEVAAKNAADVARKASSYAALWMFVSLLIGAFVASLAATFGGRKRDA